MAFSEVVLLDQKQEREGRRQESNSREKMGLSQGVEGEWGELSEWKKDQYKRAGGWDKSFLQLRLRINLM